MAVVLFKELFRQERSSGYYIIERWLYKSDPALCALQNGSQLLHLK